MAHIFRFLIMFLFAASGGVSIRAEKANPDPAVVHANNIRTDDIAYKERYFGEGENRIHYVEAGKGPLIILYQGFPSFWYSWFDQMEQLKTRYRVVAVDGLGAGLSAKPEDIEAYRIASLAAQIDGLARHLSGARRFVLIGHDWGAALAFAYAQSYPKRLNAVIGLSAPPYNLFLDLVRDNTEQQRRSEYMQLFRRLTLRDLASHGATERIWQQSYGALIARGDLTAAESELFRQALADPKAINGGMNWYRANIPPIKSISKADHWPKDNRKIGIPALVIWGDADGTFVPDFLPLMQHYAENVKVVTLPGVNHWATMEAPQSTSNEIVNFLDGIKGTRRPR